MEFAKGKDTKEKKPSLVNEQEVPSSEASLSEFFREKRKELQLQAGTGKRRDYFPLGQIAENLGVSKAVLEGKLYRKPGKTISREWIIALSVVHGINSDDANKALLLCDFPRLDAALPQEDIIIGFLDDHEGEAMRLSDLNSALWSENQPEICIDQSKIKTLDDKTDFPTSRYKTNGQIIIRTFLDEGDMYDSLETAFDFRYRCVAVQSVEDEHGNRYILEAFPDTTFTIHSPVFDLPKHFDGLEGTGDFQPLLSYILPFAKREQRRVDKQVFDSRNYRGRAGADLRGDRLHVFYEEFNYALPERSEYYLIELLNGETHLSVSQQSMFMSEYLPPETYRSRYGSLPKNERRMYNSLEEIEKRLSEVPKNSYRADLLRSRRSAFKRLSQKLDEIVGQIKDRTLFVRNLEYIYENPGDVCTYYGIENEFKCTHDDWDEIIVGELETTVQVDADKKVTISFDELKRAFELGYQSWDQILRIKGSRGSVEAVF